MQKNRCSTLRDSRELVDRKEVEKGGENVQRSLNILAFTLIVSNQES
jgi:hypothetical protein